MYVVTGATGNTGRIVANRLLAAGKKVRVVGRDAAKLKPFVSKGAEPIVGDLEDPKALSKAFNGARAVYAMVPPDYTSPDPGGHQKRTGEAIAGALSELRVPHCVFLSSIGAQNREGAGPVSGLGRIEDVLSKNSHTHIRMLRPAFFMENLYNMIPTIKQGFIATPIQADLAMPWIATEDIGNVAADELLALDFTGKTTRELHGQRDLTMNEATAIVGKAIGSPNLKYIAAGYEDAEKAMVGMGLQPALVKSFVEMYRAMNEKRMKALEPRSDKTTTPTSLESFAKGFAAAVA